jgi:hypothetical protein
VNGEDVLGKEEREIDLEYDTACEEEVARVGRGKRRGGCSSLFECIGALTDVLTMK